MNFLVTGITGFAAPHLARLLLKNNHGFKDKHDVDYTTDGEKIEKIIYTKPEGAKDGSDTHKTDN